MTTGNAVNDTVNRLVSTVVNGFEVLRYGGLQVEQDPAPFEVVAHEPVFRLRHYFPDRPSGSSRRSCRR